MNTNTNALPYEVRITTIVDAPERRGPSYRPVAPGTPIHITERFATQRRAVSFYNEIMAGEWDFGSEYVSRIQALKMRPNRSPRVVRRTHCRARTAAGVQTVEILGA
jgi:hypothetical protein